MHLPQNTERLRASRDLLLELRQDRALATERFTWPELEAEFNWATDWFDVIARDNDRLALWIVEEDGRETTVTYAEMAARSERVAAWLASVGVGHGDHVLLMLGNQVELWETMLAIIRLGAVIMPTSTMLASHDLADRISRGLVRHVIADPDDAQKFDGVPGDYTRISVGGARDGWLDYADWRGFDGPAPDTTTMADDPCLIYFTSGTTSKPKMVVHTQRSYPVGHLSTMYWLGVQPGDVHLAISSPGWGKHAWSCFFAPWNAEATVFIYNYSKFDPIALRNQLDRAEVSTFCAPPTVWRMLIQADLGDPPTHLREALSAGEPLNPEVIDRVRGAWDLEIRDGYGQTETTALVGNTPGTPVVAGSMGMPLPGVAIALLDPLTGQVASEGEICLDLSRHPLNLMTGYLADEDRTTDAFRDGWFHTGDVAVSSDDGRITFIGRTDDIFKSSDYKVSPFEVESVLIEHSAVAEAAVVPAPDDTRLNVVKAYVSLAAGWEANDETAFALLAHARSRLPAYARVRRIEFSELPKTISGKIRRVELRDRETAAATGGIGLPGEWRDSSFPALRAEAR